MARVKPKQGEDGLRGRDSQQGDLQDSDTGRELPAGLTQERKGPLNPKSGRKVDSKLQGRRA